MYEQKQSQHWYTMEVKSIAVCLICRGSITAEMLFSFSIYITSATSAASESQTCVNHMHVNTTSSAAVSMVASLPNDIW